MKVVFPSFPCLFPSAWKQRSVPAPPSPLRPHPGHLLPHPTPRWCRDSPAPPHPGFSAPTQSPCAPHLSPSPAQGRPRELPAGAAARAPRASSQQGQWRLPRSPASSGGGALPAGGLDLARPCMDLWIWVFKWIRKTSTELWSQVIELTFNMDAEFHPNSERQVGIRNEWHCHKLFRKRPHQNL
jgi:hypothetical protein